LLRFLKRDLCRGTFWRVKKRIVKIFLFLKYTNYLSSNWAQRSHQEINPYLILSRKQLGPDYRNLNGNSGRRIRLGWLCRAKSGRRRISVGGSFAILKESSLKKGCREYADGEKGGLVLDFLYLVLVLEIVG
jgi:hypothetical protein